MSCFHVTCVTSDWRSIEWSHCAASSATYRERKDEAEYELQYYVQVAVDISWWSEFVQPKPEDCTLICYSIVKRATVDFLWDFTMLW